MRASTGSAMSDCLRFDRLPKWAQGRIELLEKSVDYWQGKANEGPEDSDTFIKRYVSKDKPLGRGDTILFTTDDSRHNVEVTNHGDRIEVRGMDLLTVRPVSSNVITITAEGF